MHTYSIQSQRTVSGTLYKQNVTLSQSVQNGGNCLVSHRTPHSTLSWVGDGTWPRTSWIWHQVAGCSRHRQQPLEEMPSRQVWTCKCKLMERQE